MGWIGEGGKHGQGSVLFSCFVCGFLGVSEEGRVRGLLVRLSSQLHCPTKVGTESWRRCRPREPWRIHVFSAGETGVEMVVRDEGEAMGQGKIHGRAVVGHREGHAG
jgi:hypothetical protein